MLLYRSLGVEGQTLLCHNKAHLDSFLAILSKQIKVNTDQDNG